MVLRSISEMPPSLRADAACKIAEMVDRQRQVGRHGFADRLAVVPGFSLGQMGEIFLHSGRQCGSAPERVLPRWLRPRRIWQRARRPARLRYLRGRNARSCPITLPVSGEILSKVRPLLAGTQRPPDPVINNVPSAAGASARRRVSACPFSGSPLQSAPGPVDFRARGGW